MTSPLQIRPTEPEDLSELSRLFRARFGHSLGLEEWEWKYRRCPGETRSLVAVDREGKITAHAGALGLSARDPAMGDGERPDREGRPAGRDAPRDGAPEDGRDADPSKGLLWQVTDVVAARQVSGLRPPAIRLLEALFQEIPREEDLPWIFGFPGERHRELGRRLFGYRDLGPIPELGGGLEDAAEGEPLEGFDRPDSWAEAAWRARGLPSVERSVSFLAWRYWSRPERYYRFYRLESTVELATGKPDSGLAVFAFSGDEARATELWLPGSAERYEGGLRRVAADLLASGLRSWSFWAHPSPFPPSLAHSLELAPLERRWTVALRGRGPGKAPPPPRAGELTYTLGDYDAV